ncbi:MAG TPA: inositol monophosphatase family protein [Methanocella sp.]|jgi:myo-inositol-1(or 4)-monophosphatase
MDDLELVTRLAERVRAATLSYAAETPDFAEVVRQRPRDVTRKIDMAAEAELDAAIADEGIAARIISEEIGERVVPAGGTPEYTFVFDPVDGSNNIVAGIPYFCTSLALSRETASVTFADIGASAVASACCGTFSAARGKGAYLDGKKIVRKRREGKPSYAIYSYGAGAMPGGLIALEEDEDCIVRTMGSLALDICMVARGSFDAVIDTRFKVSGYDFMGAALVLTESGGCINRMDGLGIESLPLDASGVSIIGAGDRGMMDRLLTVVNIEKRR